MTETKPGSLDPFTVSVPSSNVERLHQLFRKYLYTYNDREWRGYERGTVSMRIEFARQDDGNFLATIYYDIHAMNKIDLDLLVPETGEIKHYERMPKSDFDAVLGMFAELSSPAETR